MPTPRPPVAPEHGVHAERVLAQLVNDQGHVQVLVGDRMVVLVSQREVTARIILRAGALDSLVGGTAQDQQRGHDQRLTTQRPGQSRHLAPLVWLNRPG